MAPTDDKHTVSPETLRRLAVIAAVATVILTAVAFWLSYEHLHDVAQRFGLSGARAWAWPATVDLFIVIGETLILRGALRHITDRAAIFLAVVGSTGSIALNVAGVGDHAAAMTYIVAAVPPVAALLAFGALMRQLLGALGGNNTAALSPAAASPGDNSAPALGDDLATTGAVSGDNSTPPTGARTDLSKRQDEPLPVAKSTPPVAAKTDAEVAPARRQRAPRPAAKKALPSGRRSMDEWVELAGPIFHSELQRLRRQPTAIEFAEAIKKAKLGSVSVSTAKNIRTEILDRTDLPQLS